MSLSGLSWLLTALGSSSQLVPLASQTPPPRSSMDEFNLYYYNNYTGDLAKLKSVNLSIKIVLCPFRRLIATVGNKYVDKACKYVFPCKMGVIIL